MLRTGPLALFEDLGRPGYARVGVGKSGAADRGAHALANRIVGNGSGEATIEVLFGGLEFVSHAHTTIAVTGAPAPVTINGRQADHHTPLYLKPDDVVKLGRPPAGLRSYLAVAGGFAEKPVLGSRSYDTMARIGPEPLTRGRVLALRGEPHEAPTMGFVPVRLATLDPIAVEVIPGPRDDWMHDGLGPLTRRPWTVSSNSDRVGVRLEGDPLERADAFADRELPSEGAVRGSIQVPGSGLPVVFLADHPVTGGYPIVGVLTDESTDRLAQACPGQTIRFSVARAFRT